MTCFVKDCKNVRRLCGATTNISFHKFPTNFERREQWLKAIDRTLEELCSAKIRYICSQHFKENDFKDFMNNRTLKPEAVPYIGKSQIDGCPIKREPLINTCGSSIPENQGSLECNDPLLNTDFKNPELYLDGTDPNTQKCSCSSVSLNRRIIKIEHSYVLSPSKLHAQLTKIRSKYHIQAKKAHEANKTIIRLKKRVESLQNVIANLKSKDILSNAETNHFH